MRTARSSTGRYDPRGGYGPVGYGLGGGYGPGEGVRPRRGGYIPTSFDPLNRLTDTCENITFLQLLLPAVIN